jgi:hypothetical protein
VAKYQIPLSREGARRLVEIERPAGERQSYLQEKFPEPTI